MKQIVQYDSVEQYHNFCSRALLEKADIISIIGDEKYEIVKSRYSRPGLITKEEYLKLVEEALCPQHEPTYSVGACVIHKSKHKKILGCFQLNNDGIYYYALENDGVVLAETVDKETITHMNPRHKKDVIFFDIVFPGVRV